MPSLEELIRVLLPILPEAEFSQDNDGQIVIYTGLKMPRDDGLPVASDGSGTDGLVE